MPRFWRLSILTMFLFCLGVIVGCTQGEIFGVVTGGLLAVKVITDRTEDFPYEADRSQAGQQYSLTGYVYTPGSAGKVRGEMTPKGTVTPKGTAADTLVGEGYSPLGGATVSIDGTTYQALTDANGFFILYEPPSGFNTITIQKGGTLIRFSTEIDGTATNGVVVKRTATGTVISVAGSGLPDDIFTSGQAINEVLDSFHQALEAEPDDEGAAVTTAMNLVSSGFTSETHGANSDEFRNYLQTFFLTYNNAQITLSQEQTRINGTTARWTAMKRLEATDVAAGSDILQDSHVEISLTRETGTWRISSMEVLAETDLIKERLTYSYTFDVQGPFFGTVMVGLPIAGTHQSFSNILFSPQDGEIVYDTLHGNWMLLWRKNIQQYETINFSVWFNLNNTESVPGGKPAGAGTDYEQTSALYTTYTRATELCQADNDLIVAAARNAVGIETDPYEQANVIYDYVIQRLSFDREAGFSDALAALSTTEQSSSGYANLTVALLRAAGIPAHVVYGFTDLGEGTFTLDGENGSRHTLKPHTWVRYYLPQVGWQQVDPAYEDLYHGDFFGFAAKSRMIVSVGEDNYFTSATLPDRGLESDDLSKPFSDPGSAVSHVQLTVEF